MNAMDKAGVLRCTGSIKEYKDKIATNMLEIGFRSDIVEASLRKVKRCEWAAYRDQAYRQEEVIKTVVHRFISVGDPCSFGLRQDVVDRSLPPLETIKDVLKEPHYIDIMVESLLGMHCHVLKPTGDTFTNVTSIEDIPSDHGMYYYCCSWKIAREIAANGMGVVEERGEDDFGRTYLHSSPTAAMEAKGCWRHIWGCQIAVATFSVPQLANNFTLDGKTFTAKVSDVPTLGSWSFLLTSNTLGVAPGRARKVLDDWRKAIYLLPSAL
jgi:hypothetical protein